MSPAAGDLLESRRGAAAVAAVIVLVFLGVRIALFLARDPFFDELFTLWIAAKPFGGMVEALRHDSGPPLYYLLVRPVALLWSSVGAIRLVSLAASSAAVLLILGSRSLGPARFTAAALLAIHPPAALFAADARSYALCGLFVVAAILLLERDRTVWAAAAFAAAAYSHYYGALFFPALLLRGAKGLRASGLAVLLFVPGLLLALRQPPEAMAWSHGVEPFSGLQAFLFIGRYPASLFAQDSWLPLLIALAALIGAVTARKRAFLQYVAVPIALAVAFALAGRNVYFPMRFESVLAAPLALWMATSLQARSRRLRAIVVGATVVTSALVLGRGIVDHLERPLDSYRSAALAARAAAAKGTPVVASGYLYLETATQIPAARAFPAEQAIHPGWRAEVPLPQLRREVRALPPSFIWAGEREARELPVLRGRYRATPLFVNDRAAVLRMDSWRTGGAGGAAAD